MPGICGIVDPSDSSDGLRTAVSRMSEQLVHESWHRSYDRVNPEVGVGLATVSLDFVDRAAAVAHCADTGSQIALDGELYDTAIATRSLRALGVNIEEKNPAELLLTGFLRLGPGFLRELHGSFAAAIWDGIQRKLTLITDRFASRPVYYRQLGNSLRFASGLGALVAGDDSLRRISGRGLAQFFTFGHYLRDDTMLEEARVLPAAGCYTFAADEGHLVKSTYWHLREAAVPERHDDRDWLSRIDAALAGAIRRHTSDCTGLGLSLSGGLDARTILGVMNTQQTPLKSVCMGVEGSLDHRSSAELARLAGCEYHAHILDAHFLRDFGQHLARMVQLTDGQYLSQCIVIPTLKVYRQLGIRTLLRGHAGELMHMRKAYNYSLDDAALQIRTNDELRSWLLSHLQSYMLQGVTEPVFAPHFQRSMRDLAEQSLDEDLSEVAHVERPLDRIWPLFVSQRLRRETTLSMLKFRSVVQPRLPFLDQDLIPLLMSAPSRLKLGEDIQSFVLRRHRPAFLGVTNANNGTRMGASAWRQRLASLQLRALGKLGVKGYQPYERLGLWLRRELAPLVRRVLLSPRTLDRGVFSPAGVNAVVRRHLEQGHNHTFLLMALMIFELGLRKLVDGEPGWEGTSAEAASCRVPLGMAL